MAALTRLGRAKPPLSAVASLQKAASCTMARMKTLQTITSIAIAWLALAGCPGVHPETVSGGINVRVAEWEPVERTLRNRASAELGCPYDKTTATLVNRQGRFPTEVRADGCDKSRFYTRRLRRHRGRYTTQNTVWESGGM